MEYEDFIEDKDVDRVKYYAINARTLSNDLYAKLMDISEDKVNSMTVEINDPMKMQIATTVTNLLSSVSYLYDLPTYDVPDTLIRLEGLFYYFECDYSYNLEAEYNDMQVEYISRIMDEYLIHLPEYLYLYDLPNMIEDNMYTPQEFADIVLCLVDLCSICCVLLSAGFVKSFFDVGQEEYEDMVRRYTL